MTTVPPFRLELPTQISSNAVFNSPHSGSAYPGELLARTRLDPVALRASEDAFVDQLFSSAPRFGAPLMMATYPRAWLDLNRAPGELDPSLIDGARVAGINQRIAAGLGVVPRVVSEGAAIYNGKITIAEAIDRVNSVHVPYHRKLDTLLTQAREAFGLGMLFDCHSMPSDALRAAPKVRGKIPEIVLGDRFGAAAARGIVAETQAAFEAEGFVVARNAPFAGGYITQRYGRPSRGIHAIQIEIDRGLYLDQKNVEPGAQFHEICIRIERIIGRLVAIGPDLSALAAE